MSPEPVQATKLCPTCGTRLAENATRCVVCGSEFTTKAEVKSPKAVQASQMPTIRLSLPIAILMLLLMVGLGAIAAFFGLKATNRVVDPTAVPTATSTATITLTPTDTPVPTETFTPTPLPPIEYTVKSGDYCSSIALVFGVSIQSIITLNNLDANCNLSVGRVLSIPQPTPTTAPLPSATLEPAAATRAACQQVSYTVKEDDTLSTISANYAVSMQAIKEWNGLTSDNVWVGEPLMIPLCMRAATPGPTPTPTAPPPYPAPNLLSPADGAPFTLANNTVTLQWASVGTLRSNEKYMVVVEDVTAGTGRKITDYATDTKYIVPVTFRPQDSAAHVMRWWVVVVRQTGTDENGQPIWTMAGTPSVQRVFTWSGAAGPAPTPTP
jgi:LysM repeat protein